MYSVTSARASVITAALYLYCTVKVVNTEQLHYCFCLRDTKTYICSDVSAIAPDFIVSDLGNQENNMVPGSSVAV